MTTNSKMKIREVRKQKNRRKKIRTKWILEVFEDPVSHELMIEFPPDFLKRTGWRCGDVIDFEINEDNSFAILKKMA